MVRSGLVARPALCAVLRPDCFALLFVGVVLLPLALPVLPVDSFLRYQSRLPFEVLRGEHSHAGAALPQYYADEFSWPGTVETVACVYISLLPEVRTHAGPAGGKKGRASARLAPPLIVVGRAFSKWA